jgi:APA family basic amino acid/polyamine antiporter
MAFYDRRKPMEAPYRAGQEQAAGGLRRTMRWWHLIGLGVGAIIGTGIYTLIGVGAERAGPAVIIAFLIAGLVCAFVALAYAELATMMPVAGSAYTYSYTALGEGPAWIVGWSLILEYSVVCAAVAVGWSGYAAGFMASIGLPLPGALAAGPAAGGIVNLPAVLIVFAVAGMLLVGTRESATVNGILVLLKLGAAIAFIWLCLPAFTATHFTPFVPYGFNSVMQSGEPRGVMAAAAIIFFAFYGFDAVSTAAEEVKDPRRDLIIGILGSMIVCTILYVVVAAVAIGAVPFGEFASSTEPLANVLRLLGHPRAAAVIGAVAIVALPTVILAFLFGQTRIFFVMARDRLLPERLARTNRAGTPIAVTIGTAVIVAIIAGLFPLADIAELANAGTLLAFVAVALCMMILRRGSPDAARVFRTPLPWVVGPVAVIGCIYLFISLPGGTQWRFLAWNILGLAVYLRYGRHRSRLATR